MQQKSVLQPVVSGLFNLTHRGENFAKCPSGRSRKEMQQPTLSFAMMLCSTLVA